MTDADADSEVEEPSTNRAPTRDRVAGAAEVYNGRERLRTAMYEAKETERTSRPRWPAGFLKNEPVAKAHDLADEVAATLFRMVGSRGRLRRA